MLIKPLFLITIAWSAPGPAEPTLNSPPVAMTEAMEVLALPEANRGSVAQLKKVEIYPALQAIVFDPERSLQTRWKALVTMAQADPDLALKDVRKAAKFKDWFMKSAALSALKIAKPTEGRALALELLTDKALIVRSAAVGALDSPLSSAEREALWSELTKDYNFHRGQSLWVRAQILNKLSEAPEKGEVSAFAAALKEKEGQMHVAAIIAIEKLTKHKFGTNKSTVGQKKNLALDYLQKATAL